jgi:hypothetical protein
MKNNLPVTITGHCLITDDLDNVHLNQSNAIHSPNMSQIIARILSREGNSSVARIGLGNGGTYYDTISKSTTLKYKHVRDGLPPADMGWNSTLYNETLSITNFNMYSVDNDRLSQVIIEFKLDNFNLPTQLIRNINDYIPLKLNEPFVFNEIGLFSGGLPLKPTHGYQTVRLSTDSLDNICIDAGNYEYIIVIDDGELRLISLNILKSITYLELIDLLNIDLAKYNATASIICYNDGSIINSYIKIQSNNVSKYSKVNIKKIHPVNNWLFGSLKHYSELNKPINGKSAGMRNHPLDPAKESERLLTHIIFSPVLKSNSRTFNIRYTLTIHTKKSENKDKQVLVII